MWNCQWLLCLVAIATREASSMNEHLPTKNDLKKIGGNDARFLSLNTDSEGERRSQNEPSSRHKDQLLRSSPLKTATDALSTNLTTSSTTVALVPETIAGTSTNIGKPGSHDQSHSKRHFHRSKFYRKEARAKTRSSSKSSVASGNLIPFEAGHLVSPSQDLFHNPDHGRDSIKLSESIPTASSTSPSITRGVTTGRDDSIWTASSRSLFTGESKDTTTRKLDELSSTESSENFTSSSSESRSTIDEKSSSVELMAFTFDNVAEISNSTSPRELIKQSENLTASSSIAKDHASLTTVVAVQTSDRSINKTTSPSANLNYGGIDRGQLIQSDTNDADGEFIMYNAHTNRTLDTDRISNEMSTSMTRINTTNGHSVASESPMISRGSRSTDSKGVEGIENESNSTALENNSDCSRSDVPDVSQSPRELRSSTSGDPEIKLSDRWHALPVSPFNKNNESPVKVVVPLMLDAIIKTKAKNSIVAEDLKLSQPSNLTNSDSKERSLDQRDTRRRDKLFRSVLDPNSSSSRYSSSTQELQNVRRIDGENSFHERGNVEMIPSVSENSISDPEQNLTRRSNSAQTPLHSTHEPDRPIESFIPSVIPLNTEEREVDVSLPVNKSHATESDALMKLSQSAIDVHRGPLDLVSSGLILLDDLEPVIHEALIPEEVAVPFQIETTAATGHFFAAHADLEEHCNAASYNIFLPSVNSRDSISGVDPEEKNHKSQNLTTTEDSLYIIEGFGFLKNGADDNSELEEMFDRKRDASFDYVETETYLGYPQPDDHPPALKLIDQIEFEAELPIQQEPVISTGLQWKGNINDQNEDPWWLSNESKRRRGQVVKNDDVEERSVLISNQFTAAKEIHAIPSLADKVLPDTNETNIYSYRIFLLPTVSVLIGICIVLVGCSIWCSKISVEKQPNLPKLTYFIQERQRATHLV